MWPSGHGPGLGVTQGTRRRTLETCIFVLYIQKSCKSMASSKTHRLSPLSTITLLGNCHRFSSGFWWQSQKLRSVQLHKKCQILFCELWTLQLYKINPKFKSLFPSPVVINVWLLQSPVSAPARPTKFARYLQAQTSRGVNIATFLLPQFNSKVSPVQY